MGKHAFAGPDRPHTLTPLPPNRKSLSEHTTPAFNPRRTVPNADVELDMYDENTNYLGSFYPVSDGNGVISFLWDLTDGQGDTFADTNFTGVWTVYSSPGVRPSVNLSSVNSDTPNFPAPTTKETLVQKVEPQGVKSNISGNRPSLTVWIQEPKWQPNGNWVVGVADMGSSIPFWFVYGGQLSPNEDGGIVGTLQALGKTIAPGSSANSNFDPIQIVNSPNTRTNLLTLLATTIPRYENFFWFGHGSEFCINANEPGTMMTQMDIAIALSDGPTFLESNLLLSSGGQHPYRFVWLDGCETAKGNLCEAFCIPAQNLSTNNFALGGIPSRAFLGNKNVSQFDPNPSDGNWQARSQMYSIFIRNLAQKTGYSLAALVHFAIFYMPPFTSGAPFGMEPSATSYGASDIQDIDNPSEPW